MQSGVSLQHRGVGRDRESIIREIVAEVRGMEPGEVRLDARLLDQVGDDSLDLLHFIFRVERAFEMKIKEVSLGSLEAILRADPDVSVRDFVDRAI